MDANALLDLKRGKIIWGLLKNEPVHHRRFKTRAEAIRDITDGVCDHFVGDTSELGKTCRN
jgi:hypothetical protein